MRQNPQWNRYDIYPLIKQQARETEKRRKNISDKDILGRSISRASVRRHALRLIECYNDNVAQA